MPLKDHYTATRWFGDRTAKLICKKCGLETTEVKRMEGHIARDHFRCLPGGFAALEAEELKKRKTAANAATE